MNSAPLSAHHRSGALQPCFASVPPDVLECIFSYIPLRPQQHVLRLVCQQWSRAALRSVSHLRCSVLPAPHLLMRMVGISSLCLPQCQAIPSVVLSFLAPRVTHMETSVRAHWDAFPALTSLVFNDTEPRGPSGARLPLRLPLLLTALTILSPLDSYGVPKAWTFSTPLPALRSLKLCGRLHADLVALVAVTLTSLSLAGAIADSFDTDWVLPNLVTLRIELPSHVLGYSPAPVLQWLLSAKSLRHIHVSGMAITTAWFRTLEPVHDKLLSLSVSSDGGRASTDYVKSLTGALSQLRDLTVVLDPKPSTAALHARASIYAAFGPVLHRISLVRGDVWAPSFELVRVSCTNIQHLVLNIGSGLEDIVLKWQLPHLRHLIWHRPKQGPASGVTAEAAVLLRALHTWPSLCTVEYYTQLTVAQVRYSEEVMPLLREADKRGVQVLNFGVLAGKLTPQDRQWGQRQKWLTARLVVSDGRD